ncbi:MAG TPA: 1-(5-phosphoribosyl)-5-[(5-phosphoribosylamino)methylideneamino]imidazole-4-carboxamide isomerase [Lachnospiraceae bacterium]|nr:1-(5-phosphoribosyl)-5-[(5-phosphoribosylamino)methylideneamino]imidazole-4-carboxamide isomerase [Lachnospiraceae bacterium]
MQIYPAIDIKNGQCVRLKQGRFDDMTVYGNDPLGIARKFVAAGATYLHVVDLDGARMGSGYNQEAIKKIVDTFNIPVQTGGGIRTMRDIEERIAIGVSRVILGTTAVSNPEIVKEAVKIYGDKIAVGIDAVNGRVAIQGWEKVSEVSAMELCKQMKDFGVKTIIYTDITKDGMMVGPNIEATKEIIDATGINIITSGGISAMMDIEKANQIGSHGVIIGKALYKGALDLSDVINRFEKK